MSHDPAAGAQTQLARAARLGLSAGLRTFTPLAALALGGVGRPARARRLLAGLALAEIVGDKLPWTPSRLQLPSVAGRATSAALCGATVAGPAGLAPAVGGALAATYGGYHARATLVRRSGWPDLVWALVEDAIAIVLAGSAVR